MSRIANWMRHEKTCEHCGRSFMAARSDAKTCGSACKKALQRGSKNLHMWCRKPSERSITKGETTRHCAGTVPFVAAATEPALSSLAPAGSKVQMVGDCPRSIIEALLKAWPHGTEVLYVPEHGPAQPGRINWLCRAGEVLRSRFKCCYSKVDTACVPVESLMEIKVRFVGDLKKMSPLFRA